MRKKYLQKLIKLADLLDRHGLKKEANHIDALILKAVKYSGKDSWKYKNGEFSRDSAGIWSANTPHFALQHEKEINKLEIGKSITLTTIVGEKFTVTRTGKIEIEGAKTPPPPKKDELIQILKDKQKSLAHKKRFISTLLNKLTDEENIERVWPYLDKGRNHEEWQLEFSDEPDEDDLVSKIPLTEKTTDREISNIATQLVAASQKLYSTN